LAFIIEDEDEECESKMDGECYLRVCTIIPNLFKWEEDKLYSNK
jgi:hypothetical protein